MAAPKASVLSANGGSAKDTSLDEAIFGGEVKPHLVHEAVRAEQNAARAGTMASKATASFDGVLGVQWSALGTIANNRWVGSDDWDDGDDQDHWDDSDDLLASTMVTPTAPRAQAATTVRMSFVRRFGR